MHYSKERAGAGKVSKICVFGVAVEKWVSVRRGTRIKRPERNWAKGTGYIGVGMGGVECWNPGLSHGRKRHVEAGRMPEIPYRRGRLS